MSETSLFNWRNAAVRRERYHEPLVARLTSDNKSIFQYNKDLMVFAALVGFSHSEKRPLSGDCIDIILDTYSTDQKDGFIYLLGLLETKDPKVLKDNNLKDCIRVFEEYCNAGLYVITDWLSSEPGDPNGIDTLLKKIYENMPAVEAREIEEEDLDIEF
ncbi:MAG: DNA phosphorothioation-associated protein 4 [Methyloprofundus sp.]|nr:DNA phosphorothioation-associated protein 4 [Methyloprofundus sp.]